MKLGFLVFCLLWTIFFFAAFSNLFTSLATASHYFLSPGEREKSSMKLLFNTYFTTIRFHLGTAALGSLVLTLVSVLRFWVNYMLKYQDSRCGRFLGLLMRCLLASMQRCLRFLDRTAYVQTAIHGTGFYRSCINGFFVVARNVYTIGVVAAVSSITLLIGKVSFLFPALFIPSPTTSNFTFRSSTLSTPAFYFIGNFSFTYILFPTPRYAAGRCPSSSWPAARPISSCSARKTS
jgi:hypothetical protein